MTLAQGMTFFHGSYSPVHEVDLNKCSPGKDFGRGFYLTTDLNQAIRFIPSSIRKAQASGRVEAERDYGFVSVYQLNGSFSALSFFEFQDADKQWLWFIAANRRSSLASTLTNKLDPSLQAADVIAGKVANDATNPVITTYLNGLYGSIDDEESANTAIRLLLPDRLKDQYCFLTQRAVDCLEVIDVEKHRL